MSTKLNQVQRLAASLDQLGSALMVENNEATQAAALLRQQDALLEKAARALEMAWSLKYTSGADALKLGDEVQAEIKLLRETS